ncbi:class I SAM-dependent methyltransferase [Roseiconus lacunae]|uniref:Class I SAM-dependent methyltransferase n=1 Tax=Roseiconus lacunae TaxID=2605694 RepID=A0ABT7PFW2_9BACT|nr:class I SAM-dependent methyltransferase [Roseiconus lacunae]MCD0462053.1 class I SAM-dependent methyltransferase [Roseiconus lacunae]MDM4015263.1 class I SAM-dependent methyltransferase [Roseiconus lacunae]WRQ49959.1 class I SAM-dependent methyltransferase [Stieleria sp. HD01]
MTFRTSQSQSRERYLAMCNAGEASKYDTWIDAMDRADHDACVADLEGYVRFSGDMAVLDVGSGTGALCLALVRVPGLDITALEPSQPMIALLRAKSELSDVTTVQGFCDHSDDASLFCSGTFNLIASRLLVNNLFDPLAAFRNWNDWLRPGGCVVIMDGLFDRCDWTGDWAEFVDELPLSACRTIATVPYLLEQVGLVVEHVGMMDHTNAMPSTRTKRYMVVARKPEEEQSMHPSRAV